MIWKGNVRVWAVMLVAVLAFGGAGCAKKKQTEPLDTGFSDDTSGSDYEVTTTGDGLPDIDLNNLGPWSSAGLNAIYFEFDSSALTPQALATLRDNAEQMKKQPTYVFQIAGHCDERGTQEYNLALGERRALAVRGHLISLGVSGDRLITISYGEEFPAVMGSGESAWSKNRRCEFNKAQSM